SEPIWEKFLKIIALNNVQFVFKDAHLNLKYKSEDEKKLQELTNEIVAILDGQESVIKKEKGILEGKFASLTKDEELNNLKLQQNKINKIKSRLLSGLNEDLRLKSEERLLFERLNTD
ncbi:MAG TPA: hypothetical protein VGP47_09665, partial [Parachlamydiaceae bacterium]|nr:hypothetical protein [Parachlamydiaceae bacterium]